MGVLDKFLDIMKLSDDEDDYDDFYDDEDDYEYEEKPKKVSLTGINHTMKRKRILMMLLRVQKAVPVPAAR